MNFKNNARFRIGQLVMLTSLGPTKMKIQNRIVRITGEADDFHGIWDGEFYKTGVDVVIFANWCRPLNGIELIKNRHYL